MKPYRMADGREVYTLAPWEGSAFQLLGLQLSLNEPARPGWRTLLQHAVDLEIDYSTRHTLPGLLSESYTGNGVEYSGRVGIPDIAVNPKPRVTDAPSLYSLGAAYTAAPEKVEQFLTANWPVVSGLLLAIPLSALTARQRLGRLLRRVGLLMTPEEIVLPPLLQRANDLTRELSTDGSAMPDAFERIVQDPHLRALHMTLVSTIPPSRKGEYNVDLLLGLAKLNDAGSIEAVARALQEGAARAGETAVRFVLADAGSTDGTPDAARELLGPHGLVEVEVPGSPELIEPPYHGRPHRGAALQAVFRSAQRLQARACAVVDASRRCPDPDLLERVGVALGTEARAAQVGVLLGPGINIKRTPLCGRNFEYLSEDPLLSGVLGAALVRGLQSQGVGASLKHYAANNQETDRMRVSADIDPRPLREIYLRGFERVLLAPGESRRVSFRLTPREHLARYDEARRAFVVDPGPYVIEAGASSRDIRLTTRLLVR